MSTTQAIVERCHHQMLVGTCVIRTCPHYDGGGDDDRRSEQRATYLERRHSPIRGEAMRIATMVSEEYRVTVDDVLGELRYQELIEPRHVVFYVCRHAPNPGWTYSAIGRAFQRDHSSIMSGVRKMERRANCSPAFAERLERFVLRARGAVLHEPPRSVLPDNTPEIPDLEVV